MPIKSTLKIKEILTVLENRDSISDEELTDLIISKCQVLHRQSIGMYKDFLKNYNYLEVLQKDFVSGKPKHWKVVYKGEKKE